MKYNDAVRGLISLLVLFLVPLRTSAATLSRTKLGDSEQTESNDERNSKNVSRIDQLVLCNGTTVKNFVFDFSTGKSVETLILDSCTIIGLELKRGVNMTCPRHIVFRKCRIENLKTEIEFCSSSIAGANQTLDGSFLEIIDSYVRTPIVFLGNLPQRLTVKRSELGVSSSQAFSWSLPHHISRSVPKDAIIAASNATLSLASSRRVRNILSSSRTEGRDMLTTNSSTLGGISVRQRRVLLLVCGCFTGIGCSKAAPLATHYSAVKSSWMGSLDDCEHEAQ